MEDHISDTQQQKATGILFNPDYALSEEFTTLMNKGFKFTTAAMWDEMRNISISEEIESIEVPVYFFEGKYDLVIPAVQDEEFYKNLDAQKGKKFIVFENSAHLLMLEEKAKYEHLLINVVMKEDMNQAINTQNEARRNHQLAARG